MSDQRSRRSAAWTFLASGVATAGLGALAIVGARLGLGGGPYAHVLRGYTPIGIALGGIAVALSVVASVYALRKRASLAVQKRAPTPMTTWLRIHVAAGVVAVAAVLLHAGMGAVSLEPSSGKLVLAILLLLAITGAGLRVAYARVPPRFAPVLGRVARETRDARDARDAHPSVDLPRDDARRDGQARAARFLQRWRVAHVPLTFGLVLALVAHVVGALDAHVAAVGTGDAPWRPLSGLHPSSGCGSCHRAIVDQWSASAHAHALRSPITVAQSNQMLARADAPGDTGSAGTTHLCAGCHGPVEVAATNRARLPLRRAGYEDAFLDEGVGCAACHQWRGAEVPGSAGLASFRAGLRPGSVQLGALGDAVGNAFHRSRGASVFTRDGALCVSCHDMVLDRNGDGRVEKGVDLVLQTTSDEYAAYAARGERPTCNGCHMPVLRGVTRAAEAARIPFEQDVEAPPRVVHDHGFVGVDAPLDGPPGDDRQRGAREELLRSAARLELDPPPAIRGGELVISVALTNSGVGHDLPSGVAFARQMWLEVKVAGDDRPVFASGALARPGDDLCDASTFDEPGNPARRFMVGCAAADRDLVSFQQKLVDHVEVDRDRAGKPRPAKGAKETWLPELTSGVVPRVRPVDGAVMSPIAPEETRRFVYRVPLRGAHAITASVRLLFRSVAPYTIRALAAGQAPDEPRLDGLVDRLEVVEMASRSIVTSR